MNAIETMIREEPYLTGSEVARRLGVSRERVRQIRSTMKPAPKPKPTQLTALLADLDGEQFVGMGELAAAIGTSTKLLRSMVEQHATVRRAVDRLLADTYGSGKATCSRCGREVDRTTLAKKYRDQLYSWCRDCEADRWKRNDQRRRGESA